MTDEEKALQSGIQELKDISHGAVPPELAEVEAEALLNFIEKQQAEIEKKDIALKECERNLIEERTQRIKKDKIIDEMAENIVRSDSDLCEYIELTYKNNKCQVGSDCKQCIIEYFTKKAGDMK